MTNNQLLTFFNQRLSSLDPIFNVKNSHKIPYKTHESDL